MSQRNFNDLDHLEHSLPATWYHDPDQYRRELAAIWHREWVFLCRGATVAAGAFATFEIGGQNVLLVRDGDGTLRGFFNTCRHRGSILCTQTAGTLGTRLITCPYHRWSYALDGRLVRTPHWTPGADFDVAAHGLFPVAVREWRGFVFANLDAGAAPLEASLEPAADTLAHWPLESLVPVFTRVATLRSNWKVFWENFLECYHCPGIHRELCGLVPLYSRSHMDARDDPDWPAHAENNAPEYRGGLRHGAETWSTDGLAHGPRFAGLSEDELRRGYTFCTVIPTMFFIAHVDYVRFIAIRPLGPESTEVTVEVLMTPAARDDPRSNLENITGFVTRLVDEDAAVCELNQRGVRALPFKQGVLVPQEYDVHAFHNWLRARLDRVAGGRPA